ncbi:MAG: RNA-binding S4 domain-containing protein [Bacilli bacterium]|jgi:RNA-binding S4 domain protein|nr:s4 domain protein YaaA [Firmicutes bacterium CAG:345]
MKDVKISTEFIRLGQLVKLLDLVDTGGQVTVYLLSNEILVNGVDEKRRGKKLYPNDVVTLDGEEYRICS